MRLARGEYLAFLDSDDLYQHYKLELHARVLDAFPEVSMTYSEFSAFDEAGPDAAWQPLMLFDGGTAATRKRFATRARRYLARCADLGHPEPGLLWLSHLPGPLRRLGVTLVQTLPRAAR